MLRIAVCDDDKEFAGEMESCLKEFEPLFQVDVYYGGGALLASGIQYDFLFLDIDMGGMSGIDTARMLRRKNKKAKIIYVTAYEDFREHAFGVHAFAYLLKPVSRERIQEILKEAISYQAEEEPETLLRFETEEGLWEVEGKAILFFEYQNRKIRIVTLKGERWMRGSITRLSERMEPFGFSMPHKSFVVNLYHIKRMKGYEIVLTDGSIIPLSQKKSAQFREYFTKWLASQI